MQFNQNRPEPDDRFSPIVIIGAGFGGLGMAIRLKKAGIHSFIIVERGEEVGGTWRDNSYPGAACDVASHLYSYSFAVNPDWSRMFSGHGEILAYIKRCAESYKLLPHVRFNTTVSRSSFDEEKGLWFVEFEDGRSISTRVLISACGALSNPAYPNIDGIKSFKGAMIHTAKWDHNVSLKGKRVGVIGTGASAVQVVPEVAKEAENLKVFQRTPSWVVQKPDFSFSEKMKARFARFPFLQRLFRWFIYWVLELFGTSLIFQLPGAKYFAKLGVGNINRSISDPQLRSALTPDYAMGCKRTLLSNDYYPTFVKKNVSLITDGIQSVTPDGIQTVEGVEHFLDVIVLATGFSVPAAAAPFEIIGKGGLDMNACWEKGAEAYKGTAVSGFPNFFMLMGPNTVTGHTSVIVYSEAQIDYILQAIQLMKERRLKSVDVKPVIQQRHNQYLQKLLNKRVWATGCHSWYLTKEGKNTTMYPGYSWQFCLDLKRFELADYELRALNSRS